MTRKDLAAVVIDATDCTVLEAIAVVDAVFDSMRDSLQRGESIEIRGFGTFEPYIRKGHWIQVNNKSKKGSAEFVGPVKTPNRNYVRFWPSLYLQVMLNADHNDAS